MASVAKKVREYIENHPSVSDALKMDIVNFSSLARYISKELGIDSKEAVLAACRRFPVDRIRGYRQDAVKRILKKSRIETRTKVAAITASQGIDVLQRLGDVVEELLDENRLCRLIQVSQGTVIIVDEDAVTLVIRKLRREHVISVEKDLVEIAVTSPESVERTPGLMAFLAGTLASKGINIVEAMSCYTDTIFVLEEEAMSPAIGALTRSLK